MTCHIVNVFQKGIEREKALCKVEEEMINKEKKVKEKDNREKKKRIDR